MAQHNEFGKNGEQLAVDYLIEKGYKILARNYRFQKAEVDIIARRQDALIGVEVKARSYNDYGDPHEFVKPDQIKRLVKVIDQYIEVNDLDVEVRFDIIAIVKVMGSYKIEHLEDAFYHF